MSNLTTSHYDLDESRGRTMMVLDAWRASADSVDNDAVAATIENLVMSGIENPASTLGSSGNYYTTVPLRPCSQNVNFLWQNFISVSFNFSLSVYAYPGNATTFTKPDMDYAIYFPSSACIPSRIQLLCGNSIIWQNQFQRFEAITTMNSLPGQIIDNCPEYTTMEKIKERKPICGVYISNDQLPTPGTFTARTGQTIGTVSFTITANIDLNELTPLLSNIPFITTEMGDLRLRLFFEDMHKAMCITPIPRRGALFPAVQIQKYPLFSSFIAPTYITGGTTAATSVQDLAYLAFTSLTWEKQDYGVQITQSNFIINDFSKIAINKYISHDNRLVLPTQTWSTTLATSVPSGTGSTSLTDGSYVTNTTTRATISGTQDFIFQISAYNIYLCAFLFPFWSSSDVCLPNPYFSAVDCLLNSKSLTYIPYTYIDYRAIKNTIQAFLNDDKWGPNSCLINSLTERNMSGVDYSGYTSSTTNSAYVEPIPTGGAVNKAFLLSAALATRTAYVATTSGGTPETSVTVLTAAPSFVNATTASDVATGYNGAFLTVPNQFCLAFGLSPPNSFQKGYCMASHNPQSTQIRFKASPKIVRSLLSQATAVSGSFSCQYTEPCIAVNSGNFGSFQVDYDNSVYANACNVAPVCLALQDCCMVLEFNPTLGACQSGSVVYAEAYHEESA